MIGRGEGVKAANVSSLSRTMYVNIQEIIAQHHYCGAEKSAIQTGHCQIDLYLVRQFTHITLKDMYMQIFKILLHCKVSHPKR
jgi:hypothetical protein